MPRRFSPTLGLVLLGLMLSGVLLSGPGPTQAQTSPALTNPAAASPELTTPPELRKPLGAGEADLILGGYPVLRLRGAAGGLDPSRRIAAVTDRLTPLLGNPTIRPADIVVYLPPEKSRYNRYPVIYVLGHRVVTVDPATAKAAGTQTPLQVATVWAARLQQVLPRVNWRPSNAPETVVPAAPPLQVTKDFALVGGGEAVVSLRGRTILKVRGPQPGGLTAAERADMLTARLAQTAHRPGADAPDAVAVAALPTGEATLSLLGTPLLSVTPADAKAAGQTDPAALAASWAKNLRAALAPPPAPAAPLSVAPVPVTPPAAPAPAATAPASSPG